MNKTPKAAVRSKLPECHSLSALLQVQRYKHYFNYQTRNKEKSMAYRETYEQFIEKLQEARRPSSGRRASAFHARGASPSRGSPYRHPTPSGMPTIRPTGGTVGATPYR